MRLVRCAVLALASFIAFVPTVHAGSSNAVPTEDWMIGILGWQDGHGTIAWGSAPPSDPAGGSSQAAPPVVDVFVGAPMPRPVYMDASKNVHLDFYSKRPCGTYVLTVTVDDALLGGRTDCNGVLLDRPDPPEGYETTFFRLAPELSFIPQGAIVKVSIAYTDPGPALDIILSGEDRAVLRIPAFSTQEALYRMPEVVPEFQARTAGGIEGASDRAIERVALSGAGGLVLAVLAIRPGRRTALLCALLLAPLMAGCLGNQAPSQEAERDSGQLADAGASEAEVTTRLVDDPGLVGTETGAIVGRVSNPYGLPVEGAHVSLVKTDRFTQTDAHGLFGFPRLDPGLYTIRVDAVDYLSYDGSVDVELGVVSQVEVALAFDPRVAPDDRPHYHDYWGGKDTKVVFDGALHDFCNTPDCDRASEFYLPYEPGATPNLILPGTDRIDVTVWFDPTRASHSRAMLMVETNYDLLNGSLYMARGPGEPFHLATAWEMTDVGHQTFSTWRFRAWYDEGSYIRDGDEVDSPLGPTYDPDEILDPRLDQALEEPAILFDRVLVTIHRGALPPGPPHPDHWQGRDEIRLDEARLAQNAFQYQANGQMGFVLYVADGQGCVREQGGRIGKSFGVPGNVVPVGTETLRLVGRQEETNGPAGQTLFDWKLLYKTGKQPLSQFYHGHPDYVEGPDPAVSGDGLTWTWEIPVAPGEEDGAYNKKSAWFLLVVPSDPMTACALSLNALPHIRWDLDAMR